ncbi:DDT domain-containing protein PTM-like isoform X2 [Dioscorea cayenensis subsp. rotundata]|uniref:DDT domain-containing protein PTM-like isoform X2 n=1 Tax=Dioscorea cayennensis subsp. rotundata TaxID=55577 RepID=A0AB40CAF3_DIOCR|nr:DDT domain-containing protein PTM-like isoform X2 [Dioscorea cayenensis subsp. rotundata]
MELVGRTLKKEFAGFGTFTGVVESYDSAAGYFRIEYEDGDSEEVDFEEIGEIFKGMGEAVPVGQMRRSARGRRPKKRRRIEVGSGGLGVVDSVELSGALDVVNAGVSDGGLRENGDLGSLGEGQMDIECLDGELVGKKLDFDGDGELEQNASLEKGDFDHMGEGFRENGGNELGLDGNHGGESTSCRLEMEEQVPRRKRGRPPKVASVTPLRRSARKASVALQSPDDPAVAKDGPVSEHSAWYGLQNGVLSEELKPLLPSSSSDLGLDGLAVLDFFSVYACLRSFSRLLFLSPFTVEAFLAALKCTSANSLTDWIHFSILHSLKPHLESLALEGSESATDCLRSLNWELLDIVTWPVYLAEYLLVHGSPLSMGYKLTDLKILSEGYYKQSPMVKLEILRCLCDDVIEVEGIRLELNRRMMEFDLDVDADNKMSIDRQTKDFMKTDPFTREASEETADGNSDECCLCRMDGVLICCDGCPAAFHSRCVGVAKDLLPEGDWYCPECMIKKNDELVKLVKPFHGAEFLGIDPHGRLYYESCGYLLVSELNNTVPSYHYYNKKDVAAVIRVLNASHASYFTIIKEVAAYFDVYTDLPQPVTSNQYMSMALPPAGIGTSAEITHDAACDKIPQKSGADCSEDSTSPAKEVVAVKPIHLAVGQKKCIGFPGRGFNSVVNEKMEFESRQLKADPACYLNCYSFGRLASFIAEELQHKASECYDKESKKHLDDIKSTQLRAIARKHKKFLYSLPKLSVDVEKEKCGWCFSCKTSSDDNCIFGVADDKQFDWSKNRITGLRSEKQKKRHIVSAIHYILSIEDRIRGLLSGPWDNPYYSKSWRKLVMKATDVASLKYPLLSLELNLRRVVLSAEWMKPVDSDHRVGSASHVLTSAAHDRSSNRRHAKKNCSGAEFDFSNDVSSSGIYWWRGGRLSRQVFRWKMLPQSLASKGGRQAGCRKIRGISYPDGLEFAKRSKNIAWRAAVEMSETIAQFIFLVKDFDSNIRWTELTNTQVFSQLAKEPKKSSKPLKKVTICKKSMEGLQVKYLLDFGKTDAIPAIVSRYGAMSDESTDGRKRFWLNESHVPLNLLKVFEEKNLACLSKKKDSDMVLEEENKDNVKKRKRSDGLAYLFIKAKGFEKQICGYCNKDVQIRDAVNCQHCDGLLHKKHFRVPKGAITTTYTCTRCKDKSSVKAKAQDGKITNTKAKAQDRKITNGKAKAQDPVITHVKAKANNPVTRPKRRKLSSGKQLVVKPKRKKNVSQKSSKKGKRVILKHKKKRLGFENCEGKREPIDPGMHKRKRTTMHFSYWLNGLLFTGKPDDERVRKFREGKVLLPSQSMEVPDMQPLCCLCNEKYNSGAIYICCENCEDWFHGDTFSLTLENINNLIGFKCPKCRMRSIPACSFGEARLVAESKPMKGNSKEEVLVVKVQGQS